jgi:hypothetical protein
MAHRIIARLLLVCYGVIALWGQGLHSLVDDDGCEAAPPAEVSAEGGDYVRQAPSSCPLPEGEGSYLSGATHVHDCDHCPICQFQSLGQHYVVPAPTEIGLAACDNFLPGHVQSVQCPAPFSPAQPRAPPVI